MHPLPVFAAPTVQDDKEHRHRNGLELEEYGDFQRRSWRVQSWGKAGVYLFLLAGMLGFFGGGGFGMRKLTDASERVRLEHSRFARQGAAYDLKIMADPALAENGRMTVRVDTSLMDMLQVESITPEPESAETQGQGVAWHFRVQSGSHPVSITFRLKALRPGTGEGNVSVGDAAEFHIEHFIYP
ncbi:MAG: hypothetical protein ACREIA_02925 [Opitutaceae bacterium]